MHEGRRYRVLGSSGIEPFTCAEDQAVTGGFDSDRKRPGHVAMCVSNEEEETTFEVLQNLKRSRKRNAERVGYVGRRHRFGKTRKFADGVVPNRVMVSGHEVEPGSDALRCLRKAPLPNASRNAKKLFSTPNKDGVVHRASVAMSRRERLAALLWFPGKGLYPKRSGCHLYGFHIAPPESQNTLGI